MCSLVTDNHTHGQTTPHTTNQQYTEDACCSIAKWHNINMHTRGALMLTWCDGAHSNPAHGKITRAWKCHRNDRAFGRCVCCLSHLSIKCGQHRRQSAFKVKLREYQRKKATSNKSPHVVLGRLFAVVDTNGPGLRLHMVRFMAKKSRRRALSHLSLVSCDAGGVDYYPPLPLFVRCTLHHPAQ